MKAMQITRPNRGFSLLELLVTLAILGVLAGGALQLRELAVQRSKEQDLRSALRDIREAIDAYKRASDGGRLAKAADASGYPRQLSELVDGVVDARNPRAAKIYFLRRLPRDPMAQASLPADQTWGLRSYDSPPDAPRAGADVFDVASMSERLGLNGRPYNGW